MKGTQRIISSWLAVCLVLSMLPIQVLASETEPAPETIAAETVAEETIEQETTEPVPMEPVTETITVQLVPEVDLPDNEELFALFAERELYGYEIATFGTTARASLNAIEQEIYDALKAKIEAVALNGGSTEFAVSDISGLKTTWTNEDLGVDSIDSTVEVETAFLSQFDPHDIVEALLQDCPFDLYWYDKTVGFSINYQTVKSGYTQNGVTICDTATISNLTFMFTVSEDYHTGTYTVTSDVAKVTTAKNNAAAVVAANASKSEYEKLKAYKEYICDAVSYNHSAEENSSTPYGDPWQLIYVFDGDDATEVVCEGYAKAFQYLCDLGGLDCISVTGTMTGGTGSGNHMWNVVTLEGKNYLVDVTNCDEGTIGAPDLLFLVGAYYEHGAYYVDCGYETLCFICSNLGLEEKDYSESQQPSQPVTTYTVTVEASENGTVTASPATAEAGTVITLTVTPAEGYTLKSLTVKQRTADVTVTDNQFIMPEGNVNITAEFKIAPLATEENSLDYLIANLPTVTDPTGAKYYFYNQLTDIEKAMYWKMSEATWNSPTITISGAGGEDMLPELSTYAFRALTALQADSPEYHMYWQRKMGVCFTYYDGLYTLTLFKLEGSTDYLIQKAKARVQEIVSIVGTEGDTYSRARDLLEYMHNQMDYSHYYPFRTNTTQEYDHNAIGALVYNNATCEGFSDSVKMLCDALNIPCIVVGNAGHAWNFIQMDDGLWYSADASADCSFYYVSKANLIGKQEMQGNSNYTSSDLYLWSAGDFSFPDVPDNDYVYDGNYQETYHDAVNSFIEPDPRFIYSINSDGVSCTITDYEGVQSGDLIVPASIDGYTVTAIGESAFHGCTGFTGDLIIPDTVTIIGDGAFQECTQLSGQFNLPEKLESIGSCAFVGNEKMKGSLNFSDGLSNIGRAAFYKCSSLTGDIRLPNGVTLGADIFTYCEGLDGTIYLPDDMIWSGNILTGTGITAIEVSENNENYATADGLLYTKDMKRLLAGPGGKTGDLIIPEGVEIISRAAFYKYTNLNGTLKLPESLRIIEEFAIYGTHLTGDVIIPDSVESIGAHAFVSNYFNGQLKLPKNLKRIEESTFSARFTGTLEIPAAVEYIGSQAFYGNQELESIIFSGDAPVIESDSFGFLEATCYYPAGNSTWDSVIQNNYGANQTFSWKPYCVGDHVYDQEIVDAKYLVSEATSTTPAVYRKSCKCGAAGEETFTDGELKAPEFKDVPVDAYYYDPVMWAVEKGVTNGYGGADTFAPDIDCTRGQIVTFLWRAAGSPEPASSAMSFDDVEESDFYYKAVLWAVENGITNGYGGADTFAPDVTCTRGQVVTMLNRYLGGKATSMENPFDDVTEGAFYYDAVLWAAESGITTGTSATTFEPDATCTRGQIVTFLYRALYQHR